MVGRSLLGVCNTETHCSVPLAPSCGISSGSLSLWMARHFQTRQVANHGTSQHALALQTVLQVHVASHCVLMLYTICKSSASSCQCWLHLHPLILDLHYLLLACCQVMIFIDSNVPVKSSASVGTIPICSLEQTSRRRCPMLHI